MGRILLKDVGVGMKIENRRTHAKGVVVGTNGKDRLRVKLTSGKRVDVTEDGSGEIRWTTTRKSRLSLGGI